MRSPCARAQTRLPATPQTQLQAVESTTQLPGSSHPPCRNSRSAKRSRPTPIGRVLSNMSGPSMLQRVRGLASIWESPWERTTAPFAASATSTARLSMASSSRRQTFCRSSRSQHQNQPQPPSPRTPHLRRNRDPRALSRPGPQHLAPPA